MRSPTCFLSSKTRALAFTSGGGEFVLFVFAAGALTASNLVGSNAETEIGTLISSALAIEPNIITNDIVKAITREIVRFTIYLLVGCTSLLLNIFLRLYSTVAMCFAIASQRIGSKLNIAIPVQLSILLMGRTQVDLCSDRR
jgi:hypothetical protein